MRLMRARFSLERHVPAQYVGPILLLVGSCFGSILALLLIVTSSQDTLQHSREQQAIANAFRNEAEMVQHDLQDYAKWDEAVRHVTLRFSPAWIDDNITAYLGKTQGYDHVFVLDERDRTVYAFSRGRRGKDDARATIGPGLDAALAAVRRGARGPAAVNGYARRGDTLYVYSVGAILPLTGKIQLPAGRPRALIIAEKVDPRFLRRLADDQHLPALRLHPGVNLPGKVSVRAIDGRYLGTVDWMSDRPGTELLHHVLPGLLAIACLAVIASVAILRRGRRTIQALQASEARARHHALHDTLTGLPNRRAMVTHVRDAIACERRVMLLYMDLDGFKDANDIYGHAAGDELLRSAASRIVAAIPDAAEALVARAGGDEFAVVLSDPVDRLAEETASRILGAFHEPFAIGGYSITVGVSIGMADTGGAPTDDELIRRADVAMYAAKADGKQCWRGYEATLDADHVVRKRMEADLRSAVERGEIEVVFQPIIAAGSRRVVAVETLARWTHDIHGAVPPDIFVPLAERSGLISALGRHVLTQACRAARHWDVAVAVNLSPAQFWDRNLAAEVRAVLDETGFPAARLELEITESYLLRRPEAAASVIDDLRAQGIRIALDDFGAGFASIGYLRRLSFDRIKIDRSFVEPIAHDTQAAELVAAIVALGRALRLEVTAEGVETQAQADMVTMIGCTRLQGWLFGCAVDAQTVEDQLLGRGLAVQPV